MEEDTIVWLDQKEDFIAKKIHHIFQNSYKVEAALIGVEVFPPLKRTSQDFKDAGTQFFGVWKNGELAAVTEVTIDAGQLDICSLVVHPIFFRQGFASRLLSFVLDHFIWEVAVVETGAANEPAISLYLKFGFKEQKRWVPSHGIPKVLFSKNTPGKPPYQ